VPSSTPIPSLGVVSGLVQRFYVVFRAEPTRTRSGRWSGSPTPTWQPASTWDQPSPTFLCCGAESLNFHRTDKATNGPPEGVRTRIEVLGVRVRLESQPLSTCASLLLRPPAGLDEGMTGSPMMAGKPVRTVPSPDFDEEPHFRPSPAIFSVHFCMFTKNVVYCEFCTTRPY
jgi:hypothetical protein